MKYLVAILKVVILGSAIGVMSSVGKSSPYAAFFRWDVDRRWFVAIFLLLGIPAIICFLTRRTCSVWMPVLMLVGTLLLATWVDLYSDHFKAANHGRNFTLSLDDLVWEPLIVGIVLMIPMFLMRRFISFFRRYEALA